MDLQYTNMAFCARILVGLRAHEIPAPNLYHEMLNLWLAGLILHTETSTEVWTCGSSMYPSQSIFQQSMMIEPCSNFLNACGK